MVEKCHGEMDVSEFNAVRSIVRRTRRKSAHLRAMEEDDLLQDCMLHWLRVRGGLDLATVRNPAAFMRRVLENKLRDLARNAHTEKRGLALQVPSKSFDSEHRSPNFMVREALESPGWECEFDQPAAAIDLARAIGEPLREVAEVRSTVRAATHQDPGEIVEQGRHELAPSFAG
jgi:DNA-directed RNA polymerase specialized sigma24 family protein